MTGRSWFWWVEYFSRGEQIFLATAFLVVVVGVTIGIAVAARLWCAERAIARAISRLDEVLHQDDDPVYACLCGGDLAPPNSYEEVLDCLKCNRRYTRRQLAEIFDPEGNGFGDLKGDLR